MEIYSTNIPKASYLQKFLDTLSYDGTGPISLRSTSSSSSRHGFGRPLTATGTEILIEKRIRVKK
jgi:hypothetical protein